MNTKDLSILERLLRDCAGEVRAAQIMTQLFVTPALLEHHGEKVPRAVLAQAMNMLLFADLLTRVPAGAQRVADIVSDAERVRFDHGALRTIDVAVPRGLPSGHSAFARILGPLGFQWSATYPLPRIHMIGRSFTHEDYPEDIAQFFVSEILLDGFSPQFQEAAQRIARSSRDPLIADAELSLVRLSHDGALRYAEARALLPRLLTCFGRQHAVPTLADYELLLAESAEMAWISTEGNTFNHVTERVDDIVAVAERQKALGRPMKPAIEVSASGRVRQTAYFAASVEREFVNADGNRVTRQVPGSFYEFISRDTVLCDDGRHRLDLSFDSGNAQGIFKMTAAR